MDSVKLTGASKTLAGWEASGLSYNEYWLVGDVVDEAFYWRCLEILPPIQSPGLLQVGEPSTGDSEGRDIYSTLQKHGKDWVFTGDRRARQRVTIQSREP